MTAERLREEHREKALAAIAGERQCRRRLVAGAQDVGRTGISRAVAVRVREPEHPARDDGERNGADEVRGDDERERGEHGRGVG
jgi:hypothetical protein